jgi:predicted ATPase
MRQRQCAVPPSPAEISPPGRIERTDGIPLFVEEMTKAVVEVESPEAAERTVARVPPASAVPPTLHASLMARLDRLGPAKEVAQIGSAIGREFSFELINAIARRPGAELKAGLDRLIEAGLLFCRGVLPHTTYLFKHALVRDAAYSTLLRGRRQELHRQIISVLLQDFPELVLSQPEMLAHHSAESGMLMEAIEYYVLAAKRATAGMNNMEAKAHLKRGMTLVEQLPASEPRRATLLARVGGAGWWWSS